MVVSQVIVGVGSHVTQTLSVGKPITRTQSTLPEHLLRPWSCTSQIHRSLQDLLEPTGISAFMMKWAKSYLEAHRKFRGFAVPQLTASGGMPAFKSLVRTPKTFTFTDEYFEKDDRLSSAGLGVRRLQVMGQEPMWQATVNQGGTPRRWIFETLNDVNAIQQRVRDITGHAADGKNFGLQTVAKMTTTRQQWLADEKFIVLLDSMDFGFSVAEVLLHWEIAFNTDGERTPAQARQQSLSMMLEQIDEFLAHYQWAFDNAEPKDGLVAYFEKFPRNSGSA